MLQSLVKMFSSKSLSKNLVSLLDVKLQETQGKAEKTAADAVVASDKLEAPETPESISSSCICLVVSVGSQPGSCPCNSKSYGKISYRIRGSKV
jgi:hypothetical protein